MQETEFKGQSIQEFFTALTDKKVQKAMDNLWKVLESEGHKFIRRIKIEKKNKIVSWIWDSKHIPDEVTGKCEAFDFAVIRDSKMIWDVKADTNESGTSDYLECGVVAESLGLRWGGRFRNPDNCHIETI